MTSGIQTSRFGCLGCSWMGAMLLGTVVMVSALVWIEPQWMQRAIFWREPELPPEVILIPSFGSDIGSDTELPETKVELWSEFASQGAYVPSSGLTLKTIEGSEVVFPAGAISDSRPVVITPVVRLPIKMTEGNVLPIGPILDVAVDSQEHWTFERPIEVTIPFKHALLPKGFPEGRPAIAVWEEDHWKTLPTRHDIERGVLTAEAPHGSVIGAVWLLTKVVNVTAGVAAGWAILTSEPVLTTYKLLIEQVDLTYKTKNFAIHYMGIDPAKMPPIGHEYTDNTAYKGRQQGFIPRYITDLGVFLEEGRAWLPDIHMKVSEVWVDRWDVFVIPLAGAFGATFLGGPLLIDNDMRPDGEATFPQPLEWVMRRTCIHELIHVGQDDYMSNIGITFRNQTWWMESTADYLANYLLEARTGTPDPLPLYYIKEERALPSSGWDGTDKQKWYAYARLLKWMESYGLDVPEAIHQVNKAGDFTESGIDKVLKTLTPRLGLHDYHTSFARAFYHTNLWTGEITGLPSARGVLDAQSSRFTRLATAGRRAAQMRVYAETTLTEAPVVSMLYPFFARGLPGSRGARLVVQVEAPAGATDVYVFSAELRGNPTYAGSPSAISGEKAQPTVSLISSQRLASIPREATDIDWMSVIVNNGSLTAGHAPITIRRWLLLAPAYVEFARLNGGRYAVGWHEAELKTKGGDIAFKGYEVYRRRYGAADFPDKPINSVPMTDEFFVDTPPGDGFYEYTVRVRDAVGNLSEPAPLDSDGDPFVGTWKGKLALKEGSIAELAARMMRAEVAKSGGAGGDGAGVEALITGMSSALTGLDFLFKFGIPMKFEVRAERGAYIVRPVEVLGRPLDEPEDLPLDRLGRYTIGKLPTTPQGSPVLLSLTAKDEVIRTYSDTFDDPEIGRMRFSLKVALKRIDSKPPLKPSLP
ncbi:MAG: hypothetical protein GY906_03075 [bacterium]|nr:hypothetical protein [bacterium]